MTGRITNSLASPMHPDQPGSFAAMLRPSASAPGSAEDWAAALTRCDWPVLQESSDFLAMAAEAADLEDAHSLSELVDKDPLLVIKVLAFGAALQTAAGRDPSAQTPLECILLAGVVPFLNRFRHQPAWNGFDPWQQLDTAPQPDIGPLLSRTRKAANIARAVSIARQDTQAAQVYTASQLFSAPELLGTLQGLTLPQPGSTNIHESVQAKPPVLAPASGPITLDKIMTALFKRLNLPHHLQGILHCSPEEHTDARPRLIPLAHTIAGWSVLGLDRPEAEDCIQQMASLLAQPLAETRDQMTELCED